MSFQKVLFTLACASLVGNSAVFGLTTQDPVIYVTTPTQLFLVDPDTRRIERAIVTGADGQSHGRVAVHPTRPVAYLNDVVSIAVVDLVSETISRTIELDADATEVVDELLISADGTRGYAIRGRSLWVIDSLADEVVDSVDVGAEPVDMQLHPDGSTLYVLSERGWVRVVDTSTLVVQSIALPGNAAMLAIDHSGSRLIATLPSLEAVVLIDTARNEIEATIEVGPILDGVVFAPDDSRAYVLTSEWVRSPRPDPPELMTSLAVIDAADQSVVAELPVPYRATELAISPDGAEIYLVRGSPGYSSLPLCLVPVFDLVGQSLATPIGIPDAINVQFGPPPRGATPTPGLSSERSRATGPGTLCAFVAHSRADTVAVFDVTYLRFVGEIPIEGARAIVVNDDGTHLSVAGDSILATVDTQTGSVVETFPQPTSFFAIARAPGSEIAAVTSPLGCARISTLDLRTGVQIPLVVREESTRSWDEESVFAAAFSPQGDFLYAVNHYSNFISVFEWPSGVEIATIPFQDSGYKPRSVIFHPTFPLAYVLASRQSLGRPEAIWGSQPGLVFPIDTERHSPLIPVPTEIDPLSFTLRPNRFTLYVSNTGSNSISIIDTPSNGLGTVLSVEDQPLSVEFSPDGATALVYGYELDGDPVLHVMDARINQTLYSIALEEFVSDIALVEVPGGCTAAIPYPTQTPTPSPTPAIDERCVGDCNADDSVSVDELVLGIGIALGKEQMDMCPAFECNDSNAVTVDCLTTAVRSSIEGCAIQ